MFEHLPSGKFLRGEEIKVYFIILKNNIKFIQISP